MQCDVISMQVLILAMQCDVISMQVLTSDGHPGVPGLSQPSSSPRQVVTGRIHGCSCCLLKWKSNLSWWLLCSRKYSDILGFNFLDKYLTSTHVKHQASYVVHYKHWFTRYKTKTSQGCCKRKMREKSCYLSISILFTRNIHFTHFHSSFILGTPLQTNFSLMVKKLGF